MSSHTPNSAEQATNPEAPGSLIYLPEAVDPELEQRLIGFLDNVEVIPFAEHDPRQQFAFTHPVYDGHEVNRAEAAAGSPIWFRGQAAEGVRMPSLLRELAGVALAAIKPALVSEGIDPPTDLPSVYVQKYGPDALFVPHVDRNIYGPLIVGASAGPGSVTLGFSKEGSSETYDYRIEPRSVYVMGGELRTDWEHSIKDVSDLRYGITFRTAAED